MLLTPTDLAERWSTSLAYLAELRQSGSGPDFIRLGHRTVRYRLFDVEGYEMANLVELER